MLDLKEFFTFGKGGCERENLALAEEKEQRPMSRWPGNRTDNTGWNPKESKGKCREVWRAHDSVSTAL